LAKTIPSVCRGSLFSHQEFALASYLEIPLLAFQELGVKQDNGIIRFLRANAISFTDRSLLPNVIADKVQERGWAPHWRKELVLKREPKQFSDATRVECPLGSNLDTSKADSSTLMCATDTATK